jgi:hypothetical protein
VSATVGVHLTVSPVRFIPLGTGGSIEKSYGFTPPVAVNVDVYRRFCVASLLGQVTVSSLGLIRMEQRWWSCRPAFPFHPSP